MNEDSIKFNQAMKPFQGFQDPIQFLQTARFHKSL